MFLTKISVCGHGAYVFLSLTAQFQVLLHESFFLISPPFHSDDISIQGKSSQTVVSTSLPFHHCHAPSLPCSSLEFQTL